MVAIGNRNFEGPYTQDSRPRGPHGIVAVAGDDENGWVAIGSDGHSYFGAPTKAPTTPPVANQ